MGPAYVGGQFGYSSGDPNDTTKDKSRPRQHDVLGPLPALRERQPAVLAVQRLPATAAARAASQPSAPTRQNLWLWSGFAGFNPTPKINLEGSLSYMYADKKPNGFDSDKYGWEADIKASYKIYDNLTYMVGAGYLWTGDYFKGATNASTGNDYLLMNQLTLNF